mgnify:FL=1
MQYNPGNYEKYMTKNPLKRKMVERLNKKIVGYVQQICEQIREKDKDKVVKILDAGCGEGFITDLLARNVELIGLEYTREAIDIAKAANQEISFVQGDIYAIPFEKNEFDLVLCTEVLEHLERPDRALRELTRVASHTILLTVPSEPWFCMGNLLTLKNVSRFGNPIDHINHWTYGGFKKYVHSLTEGGQIYSRSFPWTIAVCRIT